MQIWLNVRWKRTVNQIFIFSRQIARYFSIHFESISNVIQQAKGTHCIHPCFYIHQNIFNTLIHGIQERIHGFCETLPCILPIQCRIIQSRHRTFLVRIQLKFGICHFLFYSFSPEVPSFFLLRYHGSNKLSAASSPDSSISAHILGAPSDMA